MHRPNLIQLYLINWKILIRIAFLVCSYITLKSRNIVSVVLKVMPSYMYWTTE